MATKHLTYAELAEVWGVSKDAARKKVEGLHLPRKPGNDGRTRVTIDLEEVTHTPKPSRSEAGGRPGGDREEVPQETTRPPGPEVIALGAQIAILEARAVELRADLERERAETQRERAERLQERERADRLTDEVASLARQLAQSVQEAAERERGLRESAAAESARVAAIMADLEALRARPWWRRLRMGQSA